MCQAAVARFGAKYPYRWMYFGGLKKIDWRSSILKTIFCGIFDKKQVSDFENFAILTPLVALSSSEDTARVGQETGRVSFLLQSNISLTQGGDTSLNHSLMVKL